MKLVIVGNGGKSVILMRPLFQGLGLGLGYSVSNCHSSIAMDANSILFSTSLFKLVYKLTVVLRYKLTPNYTTKQGSAASFRIDCFEVVPY